MPIRESIKPKAPPANVPVSPPDPRAWQGMTVQRCPAPGLVMCSTCRGYGRWWEVLNFIGSGQNRDQKCFDCNGTGFVDPKACQHKWRFVKYLNIRNTERKERCTKCKATRTVDSS